MHTLDESSGQRKLRPSPIRRSPNPFAHEDAMAQCLGRDAKHVARKLNLAGRTVRQWRNRFDGGHRGPGETLSLTIQTALDLGRDEDDALAPIRALAEEFGMQLVGQHTSTSATLTDLTARLTTENADVVNAVLTRCIDDDGVTLDDLKNAKREIRESRTELARLEAALEREAQKGRSQTA